MCFRFRALRDTNDASIIAEEMRTHKLASERLQVASFAGAFENETALTRAIADLLRRMGREAVQVCHGVQEYGKDIVFYVPDGFGKPGLQACVIKNTKISGDMASDDGIRTVLNQAQTALSTPWINGRGEEESIESVYIISPYECSQGSMRAISRDLVHRLGQVKFICGSDLFDAFAHYWPDFVLFESGTLTKYLSSVPKTVTIDSTVTSLVHRYANMSSDVKPMSQVYVHRDFREVLLAFSIGDKSLGDPPFHHPLTLDSVRSLETQTLEKVRRLDRAIEALAESKPLLPDAEDVFRLVAHAWAQSYKAYRMRVAQQRAEHEEERRKSYEKRRSKGEIKKAYVPLTPEELAAKIQEQPEGSVQLVLQAKVAVERYNSLAAQYRQRIAEIERTLSEAAQFVSSTSGKRENLYATPSYLAAFQIAHAAPDLVTGEPTDCQIPYVGEVVDPELRAVLITGPAGFGKTSFCKWHTVQDAKKCLDNKSLVLPIYVPLHQVEAIDSTTTFEDALILREDIRDVLRQNVERPVRLYLDGLDEVPDSARQEAILAAARRALDARRDLQVVLTTREHVRIKGLAWFRRFRIADLSDAQVDDLISRWLENSDAIRQFRAQLAQLPSLTELMRVPLLATLIISVFRHSGALPASKVGLYETFIELHCGGWDLAKNVKRDSSFGRLVKEQVLSNFASRLHYDEQRDGTVVGFGKCVAAVGSKFAVHARLILAELLEDGLLTQVGSKLLFSHLSFQEYLTAKHLEEPESKSATTILLQYYRGKDWWKEVLSFYVGRFSKPGGVLRWLDRHRRAISTKLGPTEQMLLTERYEYLLRSVHNVEIG